LFVDKAARLKQRQNTLLLGAIDMQQVLAAAAAIQRELDSDTPDMLLVRALETALVVCYWRPFSSRNSAGHLTAKDALDRELHKYMKAQRDQVHAHIDTASGRTAGVTSLMPTMGVGGFAFTESTWGFQLEWLPRIVDVAQRQHHAFQAKALAISVPGE
jgi:hypothetical protein